MKITQKEQNGIELQADRNVDLEAITSQPRTKC